MTTRRLLPGTLVFSLALAAPLSAQTSARLPGRFPTTSHVLPAPWLDRAEAPPAAQAAAAADVRERMPGLAEPFTRYGGDLKRFFTFDTFKVMGVGGALALGSHRLDTESAIESREHLQPQGRFSAGNIGGGSLIQTGVAFGALALGKATGHPRLAWLGADLARAQLVTQTFVQGVKFATGRTRPDGSDKRSLPSGHMAAASATATVLQRHLGWKVGVPAYVFATYVGASRMSADKHYLSDVLLGAAVGIAAGRSVTVGVAGHTFDLGVAPTTGGAAIMFIRR